MFDTSSVRVKKELFGVWSHVCTVSPIVSLPPVVLYIHTIYDILPTPTPTPTVPERAVFRYLTPIPTSEGRHWFTWLVMRACPASLTR